MKSFLQYLSEKIEKEGSQYTIRSEKGKNLGKYPSKEGAEKRLRQIEYFKHRKENLDHTD